MRVEYLHIDRQEVYSFNREANEQELDAFQSSSDPLVLGFNFERVHVSPTPPAFEPMPSTAERINFLRDLKARILDITTELNLTPTEVMALAQTMTPITALVDIGADETLFHAISNLPPDDPIINGSLRDMILTELQAYISRYKAFNP
ncbi:hypothetical protein [Rhodoflexus caldus]|uniref:hypothetical protein n=1 Tax=Rhodoflexus caldus TaxID=2891236 RepID=UPI002029C463|nr:hypothetical protein [Rhodoflexus caldus]